MPVSDSSKFQSIISHYLEEIKILREEVNSFCLLGFYCKIMKKYGTKNAESICLKPFILRKKWCVLFAYQTPDTNKIPFSNEIYITYNKYLASMTIFS